MTTISEIKTSLMDTIRAVESPTRPDFLITELILSLELFSTNTSLIKKLKEIFVARKLNATQIELLDNFEDALLRTYVGTSSIVHNPVEAYYAIKLFLDFQKKRSIASDLNADDFYLIKLLGYSQEAVSYCSYTSCFEFLPLRNLNRPLTIDAFYDENCQSITPLLMGVSQEQTNLLQENRVYGPFINNLLHLLEENSRYAGKNSLGNMLRGLEENLRRSSKRGAGSEHEAQTGELHAWMQGTFVPFFNTVKDRSFISVRNVQGNSLQSILDLLFVRLGLVDELHDYSIDEEKQAEFIDPGQEYCTNSWADNVDSIIQDNPSFDEIYYDETGNIAPRDPKLRAKKDIIADYNQYDLKNVSIFYHAQKFYFDALSENTMTQTKPDLLFAYLIVLKSYSGHEKFAKALEIFSGKTELLDVFLHENIIQLNTELIMAYLHHLYQEPFKNNAELTKKVDVLFHLLDQQNFSYSIPLLTEIIKQFSSVSTVKPQPLPVNDELDDEETVPELSWSDALINACLVNYKKHYSAHPPQFSFLTDLILQVARPANQQRNAELLSGWIGSNNTENNLLLNIIKKNRPSLFDINIFIQQLGEILNNKMSVTDRYFAATCLVDALFDEEMLNAITEIYPNALDGVSYLFAVLDTVGDQMDLSYETLIEKTASLKSTVSYLGTKSPEFLLPFIQRVVNENMDINWRTSPCSALFHCLTRVVVQNMLKNKSEKNSEEVFFNETNRALFIKYLAGNEVEFIALFPYLSPEKQMLVYHSSCFEFNAKLTEPSDNENEVESSEESDSEHEDESIKESDDDRSAEALLNKLDENPAQLYLATMSQNALNNLKATIARAFAENENNFADVVNTIKLSDVPLEHYQSAGLKNGNDTAQFVDEQKITFGILCLSLYNKTILTQDELGNVFDDIFNGVEGGDGDEEYRFKDLQDLYSILTKIVDSLAANPNYNLLEIDKNYLINYFNKVLELVHPDSSQKNLIDAIQLTLNQFMAIVATSSDTEEESDVSSDTEEESEVASDALTENKDASVEVNASLYNTSHNFWNTTRQAEKRVLSREQSLEPLDLDNELNSFFHPRKTAKIGLSESTSLNELSIEDLDIDLELQDFYFQKV